MIKRRFLYALAIFAILSPAHAFSYETDIRADIEEVYAASLKVLEKYGIEKADSSRDRIETRWIEDEVMRERSFLGLKKFKKKYSRKYRFILEFTETPRFTHVSVNAQFSFRPADSSHQTPWRKLKPSREDLRLEKDIFQSLLTVLESHRRAGV